jgi:hypothetical protein
MHELPAMSEADTMANALSDPDNPPLTEADLARLKPLPKARALRIRLRLMQEEFDARTRRLDCAPVSGQVQGEDCPPWLACCFSNCIGLR